MNLVFHVVSAIAFLMLMLWLVRLQNQLAILRQLIRGQSGQAIPTMVQWPDKFLQQFCLALEIDYQCDAGVAKSFAQPVRVRPLGLMRLHLDAGIRSLSLSQGSAGALLRVTINKNLSAVDQSHYEQQVADAIPGVIIGFAAANQD